MIIPPRNISQEFRDKVAAEMTEARHRALESLELDDLDSQEREEIDIYRDEEKERIARERKSRADRRCAECGVPWDVRTEGCHVCISRHSQRLDKEYWRAVWDLADTVSQVIGRRWCWSPNPNPRSRAAIAGLYSHKSSR